jgi:hypothetical protein
LSTEFIVAFPDAAPIDKVVAAPKALIFVAVALNKLKVALPVVTLVVKSGEVANTNAPDPVSSDIVFLSSKDVVAAKSDSLLLVVAKVPVVGTVTLVVLVVVKVKLCPPEVISEELFDNVRVAKVAGAVIATLLYVEELTVLFARRTPETDDVEPAEVYKLPPIPTPPVTTKAPEFVPILTAELVMFVVPPINALPVIPSPPKTLNAAEVVELAFNPDVTANPDRDTIPEFGLITKVVIVERPRPDPLLDETAVIKND